MEITLQVILKQLSAEVAKCNSPAQGPGCSQGNSPSAESAKYLIVTKQSSPESLRFWNEHIARPQRLQNRYGSLPGPLGRAVTFRAFGAAPE